MEIPLKQHSASPLTMRCRSEKQDDSPGAGLHWLDARKSSSKRGLLLPGALLV